MPHSPTLRPRRPALFRSSLLLASALSLSALSTAWAGDLEVTRAGSRLVLRNDEAGAAIITQDSDKLTVTPGDETTVNGSEEPRVFEGIRSVSIKATGLNITLNGVTLDRGVVARIAGDGVLMIAESSVVRNVRMRSEDSAELVIGNSTVKQNVSLRAFGEFSLLGVFDSTIDRSVTHRARDGLHDCLITDTEIGRDLAVRERDGLGLFGSITRIEDVSVGRDLRARRRDHVDIVQLVTLDTLTIGRNLSLRFRDGLSQVSTANLAIGRDFALRSRDFTPPAESLGGLSLEEENTIGRNARVRFGDGAYVFGGPVVSLQVEGRLSMIFGDGAAGAATDVGSFFRKGIRLRVGDSVNFVAEIEFDEAASLRADFGDGMNELTVAGPISGSVRVRAGDGDDEVDFSAASVGGTFDVELGGGTNQLIEPGA